MSTDNDHGITGELREWAKTLTRWWYDPVKNEYVYTSGTMSPSVDAIRLNSNILAIADRIDAEHEEELLSAHNHGYELGCEDAYEAAYQEGENAILAVLDKRGNSDVDKTMNEHGWYRALDADKKPIHLGDEVYQVEGGWVYTVKSITFYPENTTVTFECKHGYGCDSAHSVHHYHTPTVEDMLQEFARRITGRECMTARPDIIAEYADKLQLKEEV